MFNLVTINSAQGFTTTQFIKSKDLEGTLAMQHFYEEVRDFFTTALNYIKDKFPYDDIVVNYAVILDVTRRARVDVTNIYALLERFQGLMEEDELASLENEFLEYQLLDDSERPETSTVLEGGAFVNRRADQVWCEIFNMKNPVTGQQRFPY